MSTVRSLVYSAITSDPALNALGINADTCWAAGSFDGPLEGPFMVLRWGPTARGIGPVNSADLSVFVHQIGSDYSVIDGIILRLRDVMDGLVATGPASNWVSGVTWLGDGGELSDASYGTLVRTSDFRVTANTL